MKAAKALALGSAPGGLAEGPDVDLVKPQPGRPKLSEDELKISYSWTIQHLLGAKPYSEIAKETDLNASTVQKRVEFIVARLPAPHLVAARFRRAIELLLSAAK